MSHKRKFKKRIESIESIYKPMIGADNILTGIYDTKTGAVPEMAVLPKRTVQYKSKWSIQECMSIIFTTNEIALISQEDLNKKNDIKPKLNRAILTRIHNLDLYKFWACAACQTAVDTIAEDSIIYIRNLSNLKKDVSIARGVIGAECDRLAQIPDNDAERRHKTLMAWGLELQEFNNEIDRAVDINKDILNIAMRNPIMSRKNLHKHLELLIKNPNIYGLVVIYNVLKNPNISKRKLWWIYSKPTPQITALKSVQNYAGQQLHIRIKLGR